MLSGERCVQQTHLCWLRQRAKERSGCKPTSPSLPPLLPFRGGLRLHTHARGTTGQGAAVCGEPLARGLDTNLILFQKPLHLPAPQGVPPVAPELPRLSLGKRWPLPLFPSPASTRACSAAATANCQELMRSALLLSLRNSLSCCPSKNPWEVRCFQNHAATRFGSRKDFAPCGS